MELRSLNWAISFRQRIRDPHLTRWPEPARTEGNRKEASRAEKVGGRRCGRGRDGGQMMGLTEHLIDLLLRSAARFWYFRISSVQSSSLLFFAMGGGFPKTRPAVDAWNSPAFAGRVNSASGESQIRSIQDFVKFFNRRRFSGCAALDDSGQLVSAVRRSKSTQATGIKKSQIVFIFLPPPHSSAEPPFLSKLLTQLQKKITQKQKRRDDHIMIYELLSLELSRSRASRDPKLAPLRRCPAAPSICTRLRDRSR